MIFLNPPPLLPGERRQMKEFRDYVDILTAQVKFGPLKSVAVLTRFAILNAACNRFSDRLKNGPSRMYRYIKMAAKWRRFV